MVEKIPFLKPNLVKADDYIDILKKIDDSNIYSNYGPINTAFERAILKDYFGSRGAVATVNNATIGLILSISESKRRGAKFAIMPSFTFAATPLAAMWCGLTPYFLDINPNTWALNEELLEETLLKLGDDVAVVIPYATFGSPIDLGYFQSLQDRGVPVVIDAAASFGSNGYNGQFGKDFSGCVVFSFHATKAFPVGEGGLVYSRDEELIMRIRRAGNFGFDDNRESTTLGLNSKMTEYAAAIGLSTLDVFPSKQVIRQQIYKWYEELLNEHKMFEKGWTLQQTNGQVAHQFMSILCPKDQNNVDVIHALSLKGIQARTYFSPACHQQALFIDKPKGELNVTEEITTRIVSLPLWEEMKLHNVEYIVNSLNEVV